MIEFFRHFFGLCGEPHFNVQAFIGEWPTITRIVTSIKSKLFKK